MTCQFKKLQLPSNQYFKLFLESVKTIPKLHPEITNSMKNLSKLYLNYTLK